MARRAELVPVGTVFAGWTIISEPFIYRTRTHYMCRCICGREQKKNLSALKTGRIFTCRFCRRSHEYASTLCSRCGKVERDRSDKTTCAPCRKRSRENNEQLKTLVYRMYGNKCNCCGEDDPMFLSIDHVNNDGYKSKNPGGKRRGSSNLLFQVKREGYPDTYQLLCFNCNCGKARNGGVCPHKG